MSDIPYEQLEIGKKYWIRFEDCCVKGGFEAVLQKIKVSQEDFEEWELDIGSIENTASGAVEWYELEPKPQEEL
jgi:hypothetical protein